MNSTAERTANARNRNEAMMSVTRAFAVLRTVGGAPEPGLRSREISEALDLHKASTSRMLATLTALGIVERDRNRRYRVSDDFRMGLGTPFTTARLRQAARPALGLLSETLEDVAFLSVPNGLDSLCVARHIGAYPIQALSLNVGGRRPLGVGAGSLALLAWAPDGVRDELIEMQRSRLGNYRAGVEDIAAAVDEARRVGYTDLPGFVIQGMTGMGVPVRDPSGVVVAALSVAAISDRLAGDRRELAIRTLQETARKLEERLRADAGGGPAPAEGPPDIA